MRNRPSLPAPLLLALATVAGACTGESGAGFAPCVERYSALCQFGHRCCNATERLTVLEELFGYWPVDASRVVDILESESTCLDAVQEYCIISEASRVAAVDDGRLTIDPENVADCYAPLRAAVAACDAATFARFGVESSATCGAMTSGAVEPGGACYAAYECRVEGSHCARTYCQGFWECEMHETCYASRCTAACAGDGDCTGTQVCDAIYDACVDPGGGDGDTIIVGEIGTCVSPARPGQPCGAEAGSGPGFCDSASYCDELKCRAYRTAGESCDGYSNPCRSDLYCNGECVARLKKGESCDLSSWIPCDDGLVCADDTFICEEPNVLYEYCKG